MSLSKWLACLALVAPFLPVTGSPTTQKRDDMDYKSLFFGGVPTQEVLVKVDMPDVNIAQLKDAINPRPVKSVTKGRMLKAAISPSGEGEEDGIATAASLGAPPNDGQTIQQIIDPSKPPTQYQDAAYKLEGKNVIPNVNQTDMVLIQKECPQNTFPYFVNIGPVDSAGQFRDDVLYSDAVKAMGAPGNDPSNLRRALQAGIITTISDYQRTIGKVYTISPAYQNSPKPLGSTYNITWTYMTIFGANTTDGFKYSINSLPASTRPFTETKMVMGTAGFVYVGNMLDVLNAYVNDATTLVGIEQAVTAWATLNALRHLSNLSTATVLDGGTLLPVDIPRQRDVQAALDGLVSGTLGSSYGEKLAKSDALWSLVTDQNYPQCF